MIANGIEVEATCQTPTALNEYGMPTASCGAPASIHRPDRMFVRFLCTSCAEKTN